MLRHNGVAYTAPKSITRNLLYPVVEIDRHAGRDGGEMVVFLWHCLRSTLELTYVRGYRDRGRSETRDLDT